MDAEKEFGTVRDVVTSIRNIRATYKVAPGKRIAVTLYGGAATETLEAHAAVIEGLAKTEGLAVSKEGTPVPQAAADVVAGVQVYAPLGGMVDLAAEKQKLEEEKAQAEKYRATLAKKLENQDFVARAPEQVIAAEKQKLADTDERIAKLNEQLSSL